MAESIQLRILQASDEAAFRRAVAEFRAADPSWLFAFDWDDSLCFETYVEKLAHWAEGKDLPENHVPATYLVGVVGDLIVGRISIRHALNEFLAGTGGHIGYGVVPAHRNRGYATAMLKEALPLAAALGIDRVLVTCDIDNAASIRVVERNGGIFEGLADSPALDSPVRRYWIDVSGLAGDPM